MSTTADRRLAPGTVAQAAAGDDVAFADIVAAYDDDMVRIAYLVTGDVAFAHEAVASAWGIAWRKLRTLRDDDHLRPWLAAVTANEARQLLRRQRRRTIREIPMDAVAEWAGSGSAGGADMTIDLMAALLSLTTEDRAIVAMRYALGLSSAEIGHAIGLSAPGVRSRLARALARLKQELGDV
jgi:RNA polymerase sigma factor (sigma-70 family)